MDEEATSTAAASTAVPPVFGRGSAAAEPVMPTVASAAAAASQRRRFSPPSQQQISLIDSESEQVLLTDRNRNVARRGNKLLRVFDSVGDGGPSPRRSPPGGELRNILGNSGDGDELVDDMHHLLDVFNFERFLNCIFNLHRYN